MVIEQIRFTSQFELARSVVANSEMTLAPFLKNRPIYYLHMNVLVSMIRSWVQVVPVSYAAEVELIIRKHNRCQSSETEAIASHKEYYLFIDHVTKTDKIWFIEIIVHLTETLIYRPSGQWNTLCQLRANILLSLANVIQPRLNPPPYKK